MIVLESQFISRDIHGKFVLNYTPVHLLTSEFFCHFQIIDYPAASSGVLKRHNKEL